ncbi:hypothetical protein [Endozoicomonas atrinae]|uniref:hypothetical protein n=1 Tax=Endozoicomonas atrinae TaxID=1333660 RepID=UPI00082570B6|nr:hypothetical protein [Endozoicomonas atrinae]
MRLVLFFHQIYFCSLPEKTTLILADSEVLMSSVLSLLTKPFTGGDGSDRLPSSVPELCAGNMGGREVKESCSSTAAVNRSITPSTTGKDLCVRLAKVFIAGALFLNQLPLCASSSVTPINPHLSTSGAGDGEDSVWSDPAFSIPFAIGVALAGGLLCMGIYECISRCTVGEEGAQRREPSVIYRPSSSASLPDPSHQSATVSLDLTSGGAGSDPSQSQVTAEVYSPLPEMAGAFELTETKSRKRESDEQPLL